MSYDPLEDWLLQTVFIWGFFFNWFALLFIHSLVVTLSFYFSIAGVFYFFKLAFWKCFANTRYAFSVWLMFKEMIWVVIYRSVVPPEQFSQSRPRSTLCCNSYGDKNILIFIIFRKKWQCLWIFFGTSCSKQWLALIYFRDNYKTWSREAVQLTSSPPTVILVTPGFTATSN